MTTTLPVAADALIVLIGPAGAGKSTFAARRFAPTQVLSSDTLRAAVADDATDMTASAQAFAVLRFILARRLQRGRLTVVDATNVRRRDRAPLLMLAHRHRRPAVAIVFDLPLAAVLEQNRRRDGRQVDEDVVADQWVEMPRVARELLEEGFTTVAILTSSEAVGELEVEPSGLPEEVREESADEGGDEAGEDRVALGPAGDVLADGRLAGQLEPEVEDGEQEERREDGEDRAAHPPG